MRSIYYALSDADALAAEPGFPPTLQSLFLFSQLTNMSVVGRGAFSLTSTPKADRNTKRPPLPLSQGGTPNGKWNPTASAISYTHTKASTPGSSNAKAAQERLGNFVSKRGKDAEEDCESKNQQQDD